MKVATGQLVQVNFKYAIAGNSWGYGVIVAVFNNRFLVRRQNSGLTMVHTDGSALLTPVDGGLQITPLFSEGKPVLLKKSLFGKYKFPKY